MTLDPFFYQVFESLQRQGPGCPGVTRKVFSYLPPLPPGASVLDIGCGSGTQTRDLSRLTTGTITAVDNHQPFLDAVSKKAKVDGTAGRIKTVCASMDSLPFDPGQFDLIWSEGAIFIMGFEKGLAAWKPLLKKGGHMVVSDAAWFEPNPPGDLVRWWETVGGNSQNGGSAQGAGEERRTQSHKNVPAAGSRLVGELLCSHAGPDCRFENNPWIRFFLCRYP